MFPDYQSAEKAWRAAAQRTVDDAEMKFVVVHLHRLLEPDLIAPPAQGLGRPWPPLARCGQENLHAAPR